MTLVGALLAASSTSNPVPGHAKVLNDDTVSPGWLGLVVFLAMGLAVLILLRSFRRQLAKVPPTFDEPPAAGPGTGTGEG